MDTPRERARDVGRDGTRSWYWTAIVRIPDQSVKSARQFSLQSAASVQPHRSSHVGAPEIQHGGLPQRRRAGSEPTVFESLPARRDRGAPRGDRPRASAAPERECRQNAGGGRTSFAPLIKAESGMIAVVPAGNPFNFRMYARAPAYSSRESAPGLSSGIVVRISS